MIRVGLTGGIGSGKTTAARVLEGLGVPVYYADERGRWLSNNDPEVVAKVRTVFGAKAYGEDERMDRKFIAGKVFSDNGLLLKLNGIIHPAVRADDRQWCESHADAVYTIIETAILFESGFDVDVEKIVVITAPEELRITRTMHRDKTDEATVRARMAAQMSDKERLAKADFVLYSCDYELLVPQILELNRKLTEENPTQ